MGLTPEQTELLKKRVKSRARFTFFRDRTLYYRCDYDGYEFPVPVADTGNEQGDSAIFLADDKGIFFMRWIRKAMESEDDSQTPVKA